MTYHENTPDEYEPPGFSPSGTLLIHSYLCVFLYILIRVQFILMHFYNVIHFYTSKYKFSLSVCFLYPINVKTAEPICVGPHVVPGKVYQNLKNLFLKVLYFCKILKCAKNYYEIRKYYHHHYYNKITIIIIIIYLLDLPPKIQMNHSIPSVNTHHHTLQVLSRF